MLGYKDYELGITDRINIGGVYTRVQKAQPPHDNANLIGQDFMRDNNMHVRIDYTTGKAYFENADSYNAKKQSIHDTYNARILQIERKYTAQIQMMEHLQKEMKREIQELKEERSRRRRSSR
jgi:predicted DNA-binding protein YlxM (UPF0122 family)